jgi:hypothetical protein
MDPLDAWRDALERILTQHAAIPSAYGDVKSEVVFDRQRDRYLLVDVGWKGYKRAHGAFVHVDVIDGKLWIHFDGTEVGIANQLVEAGVPKDHIVLAFKHPTLREHTDFATA